jgi:hypothetical protein
MAAGAEDVASAVGKLLHGNYAFGCAVPALALYSNGPQGCGALMTCCVAAICENGKAIVMAADKMIGMGYVEGEPDITKVRELWKDCWVLFAGDDIPPVFDVIDRAKQNLSGRGIGADRTADMATVMWAVQTALESKRMADAVAVHLTPVGWTLMEFNKAGY